jgi:hypothetical protein
VPSRLVGAEREVGHERRFLAVPRTDRAVPVKQAVREGTG